jgi:flagellar assembly protein FliH
MKTPFSSSGPSSPRRPHFLGSPANDAGETRPFEPMTQADGLHQRDRNAPAPQPPAPPPIDPLQQLLAAELESARRENNARLAATIDRVQLGGARLAEEARADVLELAFQIAGKILETELGQGHEALFALIRSAVRRVGESRRVSIRLHPDDAAAVQIARDSADSGVVSLTRVELVADASLSPGDCVVDSDTGQIDGRLNSRLAELRRAALAAAEESAA